MNINNVEFHSKWIERAEFVVTASEVCGKNTRLSILNDSYLWKAKIILKCIHFGIGSFCCCTFSILSHHFTHIFISVGEQIDIPWKMLTRRAQRCGEFDATTKNDLLNFTKKGVNQLSNIHVFGNWIMYWRQRRQGITTAAAPIRETRTWTVNRMSRRHTRTEKINIDYRLKTKFVYDAII